MLSQTFSEIFQHLSTYHVNKWQPYLILSTRSNNLVTLMFHLTLLFCLGLLDASKMSPAEAGGEEARRFLVTSTVSSNTAGRPAASLADRFLTLYSLIPPKPNCNTNQSKNELSFWWFLKVMYLITHFECSWHGS